MTELLDDPGAGARTGGHSGVVQIAANLTERWRRLVIVPVIAGVIAIGLSFLMKPQFTASTLLMPPQQSQGSTAALLGMLGGGAAGTLAGAALPGLKNPADQWTALLASRTIADALLDRFELQRQYDAEFRFLAREELAARTRFRATKEGLISLEVDDENPQRAREMVLVYIEELQRLSRTLAVGEAARRRVFFEAQMQAAGKRLADAELAVKEAGISTGALKADPRAALTELAQLRAQVAAAEVRLAAVTEQLTSNASEVRQAQAQLAQLRAKLRSAQQAEVAPTGQGDYLSRIRDFKYAETVFEAIARQLELARIDEAREGSAVQVVDPPVVPEWKSKPKRAFLALFAALAVFLLLLLYELARHGLAVLRQSPGGAELFNRMRQNLRLRRAT